MATEGPSYFVHCLDTFLDLSIYSKLLSCHYLQLHLLGRLYSPFVFIYKNTCEIVLSHTKGKCPTAFFFLCEGHKFTEQATIFCLYYSFVPYKLKPASILEPKSLKFVWDSNIDSYTCLDGISLGISLNMYFSVAYQKRNT